MAKRAKPLGSNGYVTKSIGTDIINEMTLKEGWSSIPAKYFYIFVKDEENNDLELSVNGLASFTLLAGDDWREEDLVDSIEILTEDVEFRYIAKF